EQSSKNADIAVMQLVDNPHGVKIEWLETACLDRSHDEAARARFFGGRQVFIYGFPQWGPVAVGWFIEGQLDAGHPIIPSKEGNGVWVERLCILAGTQAQNLPGISGAAILDRERQRVIGVEGSFIQERSVLGTEIAQLLDEHPELAAH